MIKSYKIRIYPTKEQEQKLWQHIGARRFIWNYMLDLQQRRYDKGEKYLSAFDMIKLLTPLKRREEFMWLNGVSNTSLQRTCSDLAEAYARFFKKTARRPKFKSRKRSKPSYAVCCEQFYLDNDRFLTIQKIGKVKYKTDFDLPIGIHVAKFSNVRVSYVESTKKWIVSFGLECDSQAPELNDYSMGIDLGVKDLATVECNGEQIVFHNINKSKRMRFLKRRLKHLQRAVSRKYEANKHGNKYVKTKNIEKLEQEIRRVHARIKNIRDDYIHQTTHKLVSMLPRRVVMEDLNVSGMMKNRYLSRAISEQCFYKFIEYMRYKCEWNGIEFIQADRFYPSSKTCSRCGEVKRDLKLKDRTYTCSSCGLVIDRDYNAAINLSRYTA